MNIEEIKKQFSELEDKRYDEIKKLIFDHYEISEELVAVTPDKLKENIAVFAAISHLGDDLQDWSKKILKVFSTHLADHQECDEYSCKHSEH